MSEENELPDNAIVSVAVQITQYIDPDTAGIRVHVKWDGDNPTLSTLLGLLELGKVDLLRKRGWMR